MRRSLTIFKYTVIRNFRDVGSLMQMVLLPIVLIMILGAALGSQFTPGQIAPTIVAYLNEDVGPMGTYFNEFITSPDLDGVLAIAPVDSKEESLELLQQGQITALIHVEKDFSEKAMAGEGSSISVTGRPDSPVRVSIVENVIDSFINGANTVVAVGRMGTIQPEYVFFGGGIEDKPIAASGIMPSALDYYAVAMLVMTIMWGSIYAAADVGESYLATIGRRIKSTPIKPFEQYIGLLMSSVVTVFLQVLIIFIVTKYVYGVNWGDNQPLILLIAFLMVLVATGLGTMIGMITGDEVKATRIINILVPVSTFFAGGYVKISFTGLMGKLQYLSPNYLAHTAMFNTIYDGPVSQTIATMGGMILLIVLTFVVASLAGRRMAQ